MDTNPSAQSAETADMRARFTRKLRNLESAYRRLDRGELTGRNATASDGGRDWAYRELRDLTRSDAVCDLLDQNPRLAARWNRIERRAVGLPFAARATPTK